MTKENIIRAWKDPEYFNSLTDAERAALPENPAGPMRISDQELENVVGGMAAVRLERQLFVASPVMHSVTSTTTCGFWGTACDLSV